MSVEEHLHCDTCGKVLDSQALGITQEHKLCDNCLKAHYTLESWRADPEATLDILKREPTGPVEVDDPGKVIWRTGNKEQIIYQLQAKIAKCEREKQVLKSKLNVAVDCLEVLYQTRKATPWRYQTIQDAQ